jgi:hypothetical protein
LLYNGGKRGDGKLNESINIFWGLPQFMWEGIFNIIISLGAGLIIAFVTTFYLKRKDEVTRVEGVILEKRVNSMQEILNYLEKLSFHRELHNGRETEWYILLSSFELSLPNGPHLQYSDIFSNLEEFREFFKGFEGIIAKNKLWMDEKVRFHLALMQGYFSWINALLVSITSSKLRGVKALPLAKVPGTTRLLSKLANELKTNISQVEILVRCFFFFV